MGANIDVLKNITITKTGGVFKGGCQSERGLSLIKSFWLQKLNVDSDQLCITSSVSENPPFNKPWKSLFLHTDKMGKCIRKYISSNVKKADGDPYFLLTCHFLWL